MAGIFRYNAVNSTPIRRQTINPFCTSPGQLQDATMDNSYTIGYRSPCLSLQHGGGGAGSISPGQGRSVREFEEKMAALGKENFNLKLRIYFLEQKIPGFSSSNNNKQDGHDTLDTLLKENVDQKVELECLRNELHDKQMLLTEAARAMEVMDEQHKETQNKDKAIIDELDDKIRYLEERCEEYEKSSCEPHTLNQLIGKNEIRDDNVGNMKKIHELEKFVKQYEQKTDELTDKINEMEASINRRQDIIDKLETKIKQLEYQNTELQEQLDIKTQDMMNTEYQKLKDELIEYKQQFADKICSLDEVETKLQQKTKDYEKACNAIKELLIKNKGLQIEIEKLRKVDFSSDSLTNETADGLEACLKRSVNNTTAEAAEFITLKQKLEKLIEEKDIEIKKLKLDLKKKTANLQNLVNKELWEKNREIERLTKLLSENQMTATSMPSSPVKEIDQLQQSFTDLDYKNAIERNKNLQKKVDTLIQRLCNTAEMKSEPLVKQLRLELQEARNDTEKANLWRKECSDVCEILKDRLEELAGFLDSLLEDDVLRALAVDKRRAMRKAVNRSLEMSRSLILSKSRLSFGSEDQSLLQLSNISGLLDFTTDNNKENRTFNTHPSDHSFMIIENLKAEIKALKKELDRKKIIDLSKKERRSLPVNIENQSESEAWSEPDRKVSLARIGLEEPMLVKSTATNNTNEEHDESTTDSGSDMARKAKSKIQKKIEILEKMISERDNRILEVQCELVEADNRLKQENLRLLEVSRELDEYKKVNEMLEIEIATFKSQGSDFSELKYENDNIKQQLIKKENQLEKVQQERDSLNVEIRATEIKIETLKTDIADLKQKYEKQLEMVTDQEQQKLNKLRANLVAQFEEKLKMQENRFQENLARDWVSRTLYVEIKQDLELFQKRFTEAENTIEFLKENEIELSNQLIENEKAIRNLKKNLDDSTLQASKAALERTKAMNDKLHLETKVNELTIKLNTIEHEKLELMSRLTQIEKSNTILQTKLISYNNSGVSNKSRKRSSNVSDGSHSGYTSEDVPIAGPTTRRGGQRLENSSPDLGIESDAGRTSSVELAAAQVPLLETVEIGSDNIDDNNDHNVNLVGVRSCETESNMKKSSSDVVSGDSDNVITTKILEHDCIKVDQENKELRRKLDYTKRKLKETWEKLKTSNERKEEIERNLVQQIMKTHTVLKNVRTNLENEQNPRKEIKKDNEVKEEVKSE